MAPSSSWILNSGGPLKPNESLPMSLHDRYVLRDLFMASGL